MKPARSLMNLITVHVLPPSVVLYKPRARLGFHAEPITAMYTVFGSFGCTCSRPMCSVSDRPRKLHVRPPSVLLNTPQPGEMELREFCSPVPTYSVLVSDGAIAMSPIDMQRWFSKIGRNVVPALVVLKIPPPALAT